MKKNIRDELVKIICVDCLEEHSISRRALIDGKNRQIKKGIDPVYRCQPCSVKISSSGSKNHAWNGGRYTNSYGYIVLNINTMSEEDRKYILKGRKSPYISEHKIIMAKHIGRPLLPTEIVHHINGIKSDNRIENLELVNPQTHRAITNMESIWENKIKVLEEENQKLKEQLNDLVLD